jgi:tetratricopeptide (TPR) repeat protein
VPERNYAFVSALFALSFLMLISSANTGAFGQALMGWEQLNRALLQKPDDADLWVMKGVILAKTFEDQEAIDCFTKAIALNPNQIRAYIGRGDAYLTFEKTGLALADYLRAQALLNGKPNTKGSKEFIAVQAALARCYRGLKQYGLELPLRQELFQYVGGANELGELADCQMRNKQVKEAAVSYQKAIKKNPTQIDFHRRYAEFFATTGDYANSAQEYSRAIDLATAQHALDLSGNYQLFQRRADCYDKLGRAALALQDRRHAQRWQETIFEATPTQDSRNK